MKTPYHCAYWANALTLRGARGSIEVFSRSLAGARVDLNPHQVDAALFAVQSPFSTGVILADEVGLGKTIEAGLVIAQRWAERRRRILLVLPATLRKQWQQEIQEKFLLPTMILESGSYTQAKKAGNPNPFEQKDRIVICSYQFLVAKATDVRQLAWDLVVIDEAHRLRNIYKPGNKIASGIVTAISGAPTVLLTATPLQNSLLELYGLVSVIDKHVFGDLGSFKGQFVKDNDEIARNAELKRRLLPLCRRTLRKQVKEYIRFTERVPRWRSGLEGRPLGQWKPVQRNTGLGKDGKIGTEWRGKEEERHLSRAPTPHEGLIEGSRVADDPAVVGELR